MTQEAISPIIEDLDLIVRSALHILELQDHTGMLQLPGQTLLPTWAVETPYHDGVLTSQELEGFAVTYHIYTGCTTR